MHPDERLAIIRDRLQHYFHPDELDVIDDSHQHIGHAGSRDGGGHFTVVIKSKLFTNKSRVVVHREIYAVLADLIPHEIHALQITIK